MCLCVCMCVLVCVCVCVCVRERERERERESLRYFFSLKSFFSSSVYSVSNLACLALHNTFLGGLI